MDSISEKPIQELTVRQVGEFTQKLGFEFCSIPAPQQKYITIFTYSDESIFKMVMVYNRIDRADAVSSVYFQKYGQLPFEIHNLSMLEQMCLLK